MNDNNVTDAIVPIYCDGDFNGTGFIYRHYLVTAAHVVENLENIYFHYQGERHVLSENNRLYCKRFGKERDGLGRVIFNALAEDLAIFAIEISNSALEICADSLVDGTKALQYGYYYESDGVISLKNVCVELFNEGVVDGRPLNSQDYCMYYKQMDSTVKIIKGYSGGPILVNNNVAGMLIESLIFKGYYHIVKSKRISEIISLKNSLSLK